jgi:hypothetical protein
MGKYVQPRDQNKLKCFDNNEKIWWAIIKGDTPDDSTALFYSCSEFLKASSITLNIARERLKIPPISFPSEIRHGRSLPHRANQLHRPGAYFLAIQRRSWCYRLQVVPNALFLRPDLKKSICSEQAWIPHVLLGKFPLLRRHICTNLAITSSSSSILTNKLPNCS